MQQPVAQHVIVTIPAGVAPGQQLQARAPDGQLLQIQVPASKGPGESLQVSYVPTAVMMSVPAPQAVMLGAGGGGQFLCTLVTVGGVCCSPRVWQYQFPAALSGRISPDDFNRTIAAATKTHTYQ